MRLKHVAELNGRVLAETTLEDFSFRYIDIATVGRGVLASEPTPLTFGTAPSRARRVVQSGDTIVSTVRTYLRAVYAIRPLDQPSSLIASTGFAVLTPGPEVNQAYFSWALQSDPVIEEIVSRSVGVSYPAINPWELGNIRIPVPPLEEQRAIADFLDVETARIDALIDKKRRLITLLTERWRSVVTRKMESLGECRGTVQLRHLVECLDGKRIPLSSEERGDRQGGFPYYGASGILDHIDDYLFDEELVLLGEDGAQLGDPDYPIARVVQGKIWVNNHAHVLRPTKIDSWFLSLRLNTFDRVPYITGGTREKLTQDDVNRILIPNVDREAQVREARTLRRLRDTSERAGDHLHRQVGLLEEKRRALITAAVTGEFAVPGSSAA